MRASMCAHVAAEPGQEGLTHLDVVMPTFFSLLLAGRETPVCSSYLKILIH